ncbi:hypothetical protein C8R44DRAFT_950861 [Mycena epipterygia]|nr:hypothetical protein C8R44DRAFT_950861 [Mycena epipterygia]
MSKAFPVRRSHRRSFRTAKRVRAAQMQCSPATTSPLESTRLLLAFIRCMEAQVPTCTKSGTRPASQARHTPDRAAQWVENNILIDWVTQELGGTWPMRATDVKEDIPPTTTGKTTLESLPREVLTPQARDAITALSSCSPVLDSDAVLALLNSTLLPEILLPDHVSLAEEHNTVAWDALLSPQAQAGLTALAQQGWSIGDSDELLGILNGDVGDGVEEPSKPIHGVGSSWMTALLSSEAQQGLTVAQQTRIVADSDELLNILNSGVHTNEDPPQRTDGVNSWMLGLLLPGAQEGLAAVAQGSRSVEDSDDLLNILNARKGKVGGWEAAILSPEARSAKSREGSQRATFEDVLAELRAQMGTGDEFTEDDITDTDAISSRHTLFDCSASAMSMTSHWPSLFTGNARSKESSHGVSFPGLEGNVAAGTWIDLDVSEEEDLTPFF